tara:strand:+ start:731 stop:1039 length:309 start_codon:yes stop_codon:yes gene_type:complete
MKERTIRATKRIIQLIAFALVGFLWGLFALSYILVPIICTALLVIALVVAFIEFITGKEECDGLNILERNNWIFDDFRTETLWGKGYRILHAVTLKISGTED